MKFYCSNCGMEFESTARECPNCGETVDIFSDEDEEEDEYGVEG